MICHQQSHVHRLVQLYALEHLLVVASQENREFAKGPPHHGPLVEDAFALGATVARPRRCQTPQPALPRSTARGAFAIPRFAPTSVVARKEEHAAEVGHYDGVHNHFFKSLFGVFPRE